MYLHSIKYKLGVVRDIALLNELQDKDDVITFFRNTGINNYAEYAGEFKNLVVAPAIESVMEYGNKERIEAIVLVTSSFSQLKDKTLLGELAITLGLPEIIPFVISGTGCASFATGLQVAKGLIKSGEYNKLLFIVADQVRDNELFYRVFPGNTTIGSDGSLACIVSKEPEGVTDEYRVVDIQSAFSKEMSTKSYEKNLLEYISLYSNGFSKTCNRIYERNNIKAEQLSFFVPGNYNVSVLKNFAALAKVSFSKIFTELLSEFAHCFSADQLILLKELVVRQRVQQDDILLLVGAGDYVWGGVLVQKV